MAILWLLTILKWSCESIGTGCTRAKCPWMDSRPEDQDLPIQAQNNQCFCHNSLNTKTSRLFSACSSGKRIVKAPECFLFDCSICYCKVRIVELLLLSENKDMTGKIVSRTITSNSPVSVLWWIFLTFSKHMKEPYFIEVQIA